MTTHTALFPWTAALEVGNPQIDSEHRRLVQMLNTLHEAMMDGSSREKLEKLLTDLVTYTNTHFQHEEGLMTAARYPSYASHKLIHQRLVNKVLDFQKQFQNGRTTVSIDLMKFLKTWLQEHIMGSDQAFGQFLAAQKNRI